MVTKAQRFSTTLREGGPIYTRLGGPGGCARDRSGTRTPGFAELFTALCGAAHRGRVLVTLSLSCSAQRPDAAAYSGLIPVGF